MGGRGFAEGCGFAVGSYPAERRGLPAQSIAYTVGGGEKTYIGGGIEKNRRQDEK